MNHLARNQYRYGSAVTESAEAEFVGQVNYVGAEPEYLSGRVPALQTLGMTITDVRRGYASAGDNVEVDVVVVAGAPHIGLGTAGLPALDATMVQPGVLVQVWANRAGDRWRAGEISTDGPQNVYAGRSMRR